MSEIVTLTDFEAYYGKDIVVGGREDLIRQSVNAQIDKLCGRVLAAATYTDERHSVREVGRTSLIVYHPPIRTLTSIKSGLTSPSTLDSTAYVVEDSDAGIIRFVSQTLTPGVHQYAITYDGGFTTIPVDLRLVAMKIIAREAEHTRLGRHGQRSRSFREGQTEYLQLDLQPDEKLVLNQYKIRRMD